MYMHFVMKNMFCNPKPVKVTTVTRLGIKFTIKNTKFIPIKDRWESRDFTLKK